MIKLSITMIDQKVFYKSFATKGMIDLFLAKLELFEGLFIDLSEDEEVLHINPKHILRIEKII